MNTLHARWLNHAACPTRRDLPWIFDRTRIRPSQTIDMKLVCRTCPVFYECQHYVDREQITGGFWAGEHREHDIESLGGAA